MIDHRFGESAPLSLGVEEELMILDAETLMPAPRVQELVAAAEGLDLPGRLKTELHASVVELNTDVCATATEALAALVELRRAAIGLARERGLALAAAGSHPLIRPEELEIVPEERYLDFVAYGGPTVRRQGVSGLHLHVGMPSADGCFETLEWILPWLPVVLALSANSPYLGGAEAEFASFRAQILAELPRSGAPPAFASYGDWEVFVETLARLGVAADYTRFWWDVRPHPRFGTLEIRMPDQPTSVELSGAFVTLVQALCELAGSSPARRRDPGARGLYQQNRWAAARFGPRANLIHPDEERLVTAAALGAELLELVGAVAERLGSAGLLDPLDPSACEADRQLEVGRADGLDAVCRDLVERSLPSP